MGPGFHVLIIFTILLSLDNFANDFNSIFKIWCSWVHLGAIVVLTLATLRNDASDTERHAAMSSCRQTLRAVS